MTALTLSGCAPIPLAHYLKALGILRIVGEQVDASVKASWQQEKYTLLTDLNSAELVRFFLHDYRPAPVLAPWNGGSGFYPKDNDEALAAIEKSKISRLDLYRKAAGVARGELKELGLREKPDGDTKALLLQGCRNNFPEAALAWLDAVFVLGRNGAKFPPLLGTGGNDGRLEFTNNFMQRLTEIMDTATGLPTVEAERWLRAALFADASPGLATKAPIGQFFPGAAGGANATSGFDAPSAVNPWDFILMIEGALVFAAASIRKLDSGDDGSFVYPFCVRQAGVGYPSAAGADELEARCEMWMPLWTAPSSLAELRAIFGEGRAQLRGRQARTGGDFVQAAVTLGVDRGISAFQRYGFQVRNGLAYFAIPLERVVVRRNCRIDLLADIEQWHDRLRQKAGPRANPAPPASVAHALSCLERRIFDLSRDDSPGSLQALLAALGATERSLAQSYKWTTESYLRPFHGLRPDWLEAANDGTPEFRLAQALASTRAWLGSKTFWLREHLEPLDIVATQSHSWVKWAEKPTNDVVWHDGDLTIVLNAILSRRIMRIEKSGVPGWPDWSPRPASLEDIAAFVDGRTNDALLADLIWGLSLIDWAQVPKAPAAEPTIEPVPSSFYGLLRLCFRPMNQGREEETIPLVPVILNRAINGRGKEASILASRRLRASGCAPLVGELPVEGSLARRTAAALLFPIHSTDFLKLERTLLKTANQKNA